MANFFGNKSNASTLSEREILEQKYNRSVANLLVVILFSVVNIVLLVAKSDTYFLFSAFIPYLLANYGMYFCGMFPEEYYYDMPETEFVDTSFLVITLVIAAVIILMYFLCWLFARKKKVGWLIFALVLFSIDTVSMLVLTEFAVESFIDIAFHAWVLFYLISGIVNYSKLKKLPEEELEELGTADGEFAAESVTNSSILRMADTDVKARIFLEADALGHHIVYRRVKRVNELVIDGRVYDEYVALAEGAHTLCAYINGHKIEAKFDGAAGMFIFVDGEQIVKKIRFY